MVHMARNTSPKKKTKSKQNRYFTRKTEKSIIKFQNTEDVSVKNALYIKDVQPAFAKLVENTLFVYKFHTIGSVDVLKNDCISFLFECLPKFDHTKGHKAFSYFGVICKNWCIQKAKIYKKKLQKNVCLDDALLNKLEQSGHESVVESYEDTLLREEFWQILKSDIKSWRKKFDKPQEKVVLEAILILLENPELIPLFNKKSIYLYLRDITGYNTKQIVTNLNKFRKKYELSKKKYVSGEL